MKFTKMQGCGNDYVYVNGFTEKVADKSRAAVLVSDRHFGIGSDGLIFINPSENADVEMEMYNSDGSRSEMCGNGIRCVAKFAYDNGLVNSASLAVDTLAGIKYIKLKLDESGQAVGATVDMAPPILEPARIPCDVTKFEDYQERKSCAKENAEEAYVLKRPLKVEGETYLVSSVSMGNPHSIVYIDTPVKEFPLEKLGPVFEVHEAFPKHVNAEFVRVLDRKTIEMRVWERGAGETFACGTGACAVVVASILNGYVDNEVTVKLLGGDLHISWSGKPKDSVFMEGPAVTVFTGEIDI